ncbi:MAG: nucleotidyltransferase [Candidatus Hydrogenedentes bacterium]|nr:nucleotidyltransferase [Candidatus Hydrogenedentota bacterium]
MNTHPDFEELLQLLEEHHVDYMIVGGYAVAYHGYPRFTKDIDIFFASSVDNIRRLQNVLLAFGFSEEELLAADFSTKGNIITFGVEPTRIDLLNDIDGVSFSDAKIKVERGHYGKVKVTFIGFDDLIQNKKATQRTKDKGDVEEILQQRNKSQD